MDHVVKGNEAQDTFWSLDEFAADIERIKDSGAEEYDARNSFGDDWFGGINTRQAISMCRNGWPEQLDAALNIAESAIELCEQRHDVMQPQMQYDVTGDSVDIGRYLAGEPECMMDYPLQPTSKVGRVITLCASMGFSSAISAEAIVRRGHVVVALAMILTQLGHACEIWVDKSGTDRKSPSHKMLRQRVLVKGANDVVDPARIMFAFAHPAMLRRLFFMGYMHRKDGFGRNPDHCRSCDPKKDLPEGTIYLPSLVHDSDVPDADMALKRYLGELGLLAES